MATSEPWEISLLSGWTWRWWGAYAVVGPTEWAHNLARLWTHLSVRARGKGEKQMADTKRNETTPPPKTRDPHRTAEVVPKSHPATRPRAKTKGKRNISGPRLSHSSPRLCCSGPESILRNCFTGCYRPLSHSSALIVVSQQLQHDRQSSDFFFGKCQECFVRSVRCYVPVCGNARQVQFGGLQYRRMQHCDQCM